MGRWAPDTRERLEAAAFDLFEERGYESTTVAQIAERAGLNRATFFRHFADKREVILAGEDILEGLFVDAIAGASSSSDTTACLRIALIAADVVMTPYRRAVALRRIAVVTGNDELQERGQLKLAHLAASIARALQDRGNDELSSRLAAQMAILAFRVGFERWLRAGDHETFAPLALGALDDLRERMLLL
ncbi:DNA-binding transcriptional regulator, AcrR family [Nakamurella panacisegetis]|uniref:DNA-binding transcriptional regulator, AcrR family n=1 Tax=Nakamurella panacisegetis TaxID=1090615 RepID=A0A1H0KWC7_9ACTN|nr:TetR/AcrR family transcriptional regulator [Nakamurella panacisegetis]SDO60096.1 DNA-binding transcriptional regulator, AcrR family [Nakamurella panacisegetis]